MNDDEIATMHVRNDTKTPLTYRTIHETVTLIEKSLENNVGSRVLSGRLIRSRHTAEHQETWPYRSSHNLLRRGKWISVSADGFEKGYFWEWGYVEEAIVDGEVGQGCGVEEGGFGRIVVSFDKSIYMERGVSVEGGKEEVRWERQDVFDWEPLKEDEAGEDVDVGGGCCGSG
ncbi:hypothetical protein HN51_041453 [Arachis hypogaea]